MSCPLGHSKFEYDFPLVAFLHCTYRRTITLRLSHITDSTEEVTAKLVACTLWHHLLVKELFLFCVVEEQLLFWYHIKLNLILKMPWEIGHFLHLCLPSGANYCRKSRMLNLVKFKRKVKTSVHQNFYRLIVSTGFILFYLFGNPFKVLQ